MDYDKLEQVDGLIEYLKAKEVIGNRSNFFYGTSIELEVTRNEYRLIQEGLALLAKKGLEDE